MFHAFSHCVLPVRVWYFLENVEFGVVTPISGWLYNKFSKFFRASATSLSCQNSEIFCRSRNDQGPYGHLRRTVYWGIFDSSERENGTGQDVTGNAFICPSIFSFSINNIFISTQNWSTNYIEILYDVLWYQGALRKKQQIVGYPTVTFKIS